MTPECPKGPERDVDQRDAATFASLYRSEQVRANDLEKRLAETEDVYSELLRGMAARASEFRRDMSGIAKLYRDSARARVARDREQCAEIARLREQLAAQTLLPDNWVQQVGWLFDVHGVEQYRKVVRLIQMWQGQRDGTADTEEEEARSATSEASPIVHTVLLSSDTGVMGEWQAFCSGCRQRSMGDLAHAEFWKDQHLADVLVPQAFKDYDLANVTPGTGFFIEKDEGRPSGSTAAPRSDEELLVRLRGLVFDLRDKPTPGPFKYDNGYLDGQVQAGNDLEALLDEYAPDAAQAAGSEATQIFCAEHCPAEDPECRCSERAWHRTCCHSLSPSLRKEGEDSD